MDSFRQVLYVNKPLSQLHKCVNLHISNVANACHLFLENITGGLPDCLVATETNRKLWQLVLQCVDIACAHAVVSYHRF